MRLLGEFSKEPIDIREGEIFELVIENQRLFRNTIEDFKFQIDGEKGKTVLSINNTPIPIKRHVEVFESITLFDVNTKLVLSKIHSILGDIAIDESHYLQSQELLSSIEKYFDDLGDAYGFSLDYSKMSMDAVIKAVSPRLAEDYSNALEAFIDYMDFINSIERDKLYVFINLRSFFNDTEIKSFIDTVALKGIRVLLIESIERNKIGSIRKLVIDSDLCEI